MHHASTTEFFIDGKSHSTLKQPEKTDNNNASLILGEFFNGDIDEFRLYERGLSLDEVQKIYNSK